MCVASSNIYLYQGTGPTASFCTNRSLFNKFFQHLTTFLNINQDAAAADCEKHKGILTEHVIFDTSTTLLMWLLQMHQTAKQYNTVR